MGLELSSHPCDMGEDRHGQLCALYLAQRQAHAKVAGDSSVPALSLPPTHRHWLKPVSV